MFSLSIEQIQSGMKLAKPVFNLTGTLLLDKDNILDDRTITALRNAGAKRVWVTDEGSQFVKEQGPIKFFQYIVGAMEAVRERVILGRPIDIKLVNDLSEELVEQIVVNEVPFAEMVRMKASENTILEHMVDVAILSIIIGKALELDRLEMRYLCFGALVHDIGQLLIPKEVLNKTTPLTESEIKIIRKHPQFGYEMLKNINGINKHALKITLQHHERLDGSGYPNGTKEKDIAHFSRIVAIADIYTAIIREKGYRKRMQIHEAGELLWAQAGAGLDKGLTFAFLNSVVAFPLRSTVKLNNGQVGRVIAQNGDFPVRPVLYVNGEMIDLAENPTLFITEVISYETD
ncbi:MAG: HD-GYP domain-containing protein [Thermincola sp.]|nr:HD-GYP domain-containing protein [Thermincola sp.]MDT3703977.1 HD-GYP domain-containing protein [Thermincola sp.]